MTDERVGLLGTTGRSVDTISRRHPVGEADAEHQVRQLRPLGVCGLIAVHAGRAAAVL